MTWGVQIVKADGTPSSKNYHVCTDCKHGVADLSIGRAPCLVSVLGHWNIGALLTGVDVGRDGHMASGQAVMMCNGYENLA